MAIVCRRKLFPLLVFIAVFCFAIQQVNADESESSVTYELSVEENSVELSNDDLIVPDAVELIEESTHESSFDAEAIADEVEAETSVTSDNLQTVVDDITIDAPILKEEIVEEEEEDNVILEAAVSSLGESVSSKLISIANRFKDLAISKQNAKKIAAAGLGAWGAATGVGWAVQNFGAGKKLASN